MKWFCLQEIEARTELKHYKAQKWFYSCMSLFIIYYLLVHWTMICIYHCVTLDFIRQFMRPFKFARQFFATVLLYADTGLQAYLVQLQLWSRHWSATFFLVAECKRFSDSPFVTGHFEAAHGYFTLKIIIIYLLLYTCTPSPVVALTKPVLGAI